MNKTAHQQVLTLVGGPQQFKAGHRWPFAEIFPVRDQRFSGWKVIGLMHQGQIGGIETALERFQAAASPAHPEGTKEFCAADAIFHRHAPSALKHNRQACGR